MVDFFLVMSSDEEKPPAPPVRLTSNRGTDVINSSVELDTRPLPKEPIDAERKKKQTKSKKSNKLSTSYPLDKPNISYPMNFEHTVHVGFDPASGEFTVCNLHFIHVVKILVFRGLFLFCFINS